MRNRVIRPEILDEASDEDADLNLRDLERIHRWFGGERIAVGLLRRLFRPEDPFTLLDVGAGSGPMARVISRSFPNARVVSLDHRHRNLRRAPQPRLVADAFRPPFPTQSFDVVFCSLLLHHFELNQAVDLLRGMSSLARRVLIAVDLQRHPFARHFLPLTRWVFRWRRVTLHDGPVSVAAAFTRQELEELGRKAGLAGAVVRLHRPWFRLSLVATFPHGFPLR